MNTSIISSQDFPLAEGQIVAGTLFSEPMRVETIRPNGPDTWVVGLCGLRTEKFRKATLSRKDIESLQVFKQDATYTGVVNFLKLVFKLTRWELHTNSTPILDFQFPE